jgi:ring-1,2-phenylacetyl-CoA epoxidase subunit PaaE
MLEFLKSYFQGFGSTVVLLGLVYLVVWVLLSKPLHNRKIQLSKRAGWSQIKDEIIASLISGIGNTLFIVCILSLKSSGLTKFYDEAGRYGMWYEVVTVITLILIGDTWFYWFHRWMHNPKVYKYVHALHHRSLDVNPFTSTSFHVVESVLLTFWILPMVMIMPVSATALGIVQASGMFNNIKSHLGFELYPKFFTIPPFNMLITATNHSLHHTQYNGNYGLYFRFWDILCGTEFNTTNTIFQEIHSRNKGVIIDNTQYRILRIDKIVKENSNTVSVYFKPTDRAFYNYHAGQYLTLKVKVGRKTYNRCFSLSSSPQIDDFLRITVKLKGEVSHYFYNDAKVGDMLESLLPVGDFVFIPNATQKKHYVMVAGGSGITPLYSMIKQMLQSEPQSQVTLLYANTDEETIVFKNDLSQLAQHYAQFRYTNFISGNTRICKENLNIDANATYYICGPDALKESVLKYLEEININNVNVHLEHFADGYVPWFGVFEKKPTKGKHPKRQLLKTTEI